MDNEDIKELFNEMIVKIMKKSKDSEDFLGGCFNTSINITCFAVSELFESDEDKDKCIDFFIEKLRKGIYKSCDKKKKFDFMKDLMSKINED